MEYKLDSAPCCVVTGFGRSGTSLVASILQSAGLDIGSHLLGGGEGNERGHFEDMDMLSFHMKVLAANGVDSDGFLNPLPITVSDEQLAHAHSLVRSRLEGGKAWGWKEPRTVLFLDFWKKTIPYLNYLFLFRCPWEVIDSLFRRGDPLFRSNPKLAVDFWMGYNKAILDYCDRHPQSTMVVEAQAAADDPNMLVDAMRGRFGIALNRPSDLYEKELLHHKMSSSQRSLFLDAFPEAVDIYEKLRAKATLVLDKNPMGIQVESGAQGDAFLQFWLDCRTAEKHSHRTETALQRVQTEMERQLSAANVRVEEMQVRLAEVQQGLELAEQQLSEARWQVNELHDQRRNAELSREEVAQELTTTRSEADGMRNRLGKIEKSVVYKLSTLWTNFHNPKPKVPA